MKFHLLTIFPDFFQGPFGHGVVARAARAGLVEILVHDLRVWTKDFHKTVDDRPFGGGEGMVMKPEPVFEAVEAIWPERDRERQRIVLLSAQGPLFDQRAAHRLSRYDEILLICGRYEGVDERVSEQLADEEISIGEFVISGGELAAAVVVDSVGRLMPGACPRCCWAATMPRLSSGAARRRWRRRAVSVRIC
jgi:tRNA (guanine37-N1)-methyltransferase